MLVCAAAFSTAVNTWPRRRQGEEDLLCSEQSRKQSLCVCGYVYCTHCCCVCSGPSQTYFGRLPKQDDLSAATHAPRQHQGWLPSVLCSLQHPKNLQGLKEGTAWLNILLSFHSKQHWTPSSELSVPKETGLDTLRHVNLCTCRGVISATEAWVS